LDQVGIEIWAWDIAFSQTGIKLIESCFSIPVVQLNKRN
jgi:hypothetical protein